MKADSNLYNRKENEMKIDAFTLEVYEYLDGLRESGVTNMFGAGAYIARQFDLSSTEAKTLLMGWMETFGLERELS